MPVQSYKPKTANQNCVGYVHSYKVRDDKVIDDNISLFVSKKKTLIDAHIYHVVRSTLHHEGEYRAPPYFLMKSRAAIM